LADGEFSRKKYFFDKTIYEKRVYDSKGIAHPEVQIQFGPNIKDWPEMQPLSDDILLKVVSEIHDPVTTTDELIPSGETSSFRSNPLGLAEFTLSRKDPAYVGRAKAVRDKSEEVMAEVKRAEKILEEKYPEFKGRIEKAGLGSTIYAVKPGDGSAREQAASCQRVLGASANIASDYATKRYRSNLINWGMIPFLYKQGESQNSVLLSEFSGENSRNLLPNGLPFANGDYIFVPGAKKMIAEKLPDIKAYAVRADGTTAEFELATGDMTDDERKIIQAGCLINFYRG